MIALFLTTLAVADDPPILDVTAERASGPGSPSGPIAIEGPAITSLDFVHEGHRASVVVGTDRVSGWASHERSPTEVVLLFADAGVSDSLQRPLDTSHFEFPVDWIQARETPNGAEVRVLLRQPLDWEVETMGPDHVALRLRLAAEPTEGRIVVEKMESTQGLVIGQAGERQELPGGSHLRVLLEEADAGTAVRALSEVAGVALTVNTDEEVRVSVWLEDVTWEQALRAILEAADWEAVVVGDGLQVGPEVR